MNTILKTAALVSVLCLSACAYPQKGMAALHFLEMIG